jgi:uncharacterized protein (DUF4415 family)
VTFEEAATAFADENAVLIHDPDHSESEDRFILLGDELVPPRPRRLPLLSREGGVNSDHLSSQGDQVRAGAIPGEIAMRENYDFSKGKKNPYAKRLKKQVTIRLEEATIDYFKALADEIGVPYQTLINLYLRDCAASNRRLSLEWKPGN